MKISKTLEKLRCGDLIRDRLRGDYFMVSKIKLHVYDDPIVLAIPISLSNHPDSEQLGGLVPVYEVPIFDNTFDFISHNENCPSNSEPLLREIPNYLNKEVIHKLEPSLRGTVISTIYDINTISLRLKGPQTYSVPVTYDFLFKFKSGESLADFRHSFDVPHIPLGSYVTLNNPLITSIQTYRVSSTTSSLFPIVTLIAQSRLSKQSYPEDLHYVSVPAQFVSLTSSMSNNLSDYKHANSIKPISLYSWVTSLFGNKGLVISNTDALGYQQTRIIEWDKNDMILPKPVAYSRGALTIDKEKTKEIHKLFKVQPKTTKTINFK